MSRQRTFAAFLMGVALCTFPFLGKPVHVDDANFLVLARGALLDIWRPHDISINWQGSTERAFEVLSNPPGMGWWLLPVIDQAPALQHLWVMLWFIPAFYGVLLLGRRFCGDGQGALILLGSSPILLWSGLALTPDLPLFALGVLGLGGFCPALDERRVWSALGWAVVAGLAFWFRYSAVLVPFILLTYALLMRRAPWPAMGALLPLALLFLHDRHAYGSIHFVAMGGFQSVSESPAELFRKLVASLTMLGGAALLPTLAGSAGLLALPGALTGGFLALGGVIYSGIPMEPGVWTVLLGMGGGAVLLGPWVPGLRRPFTSLSDLPYSQASRRDTLFLLLWALLGLVFLVNLRFMATRYWLPFLPPLALAWLRLRPSPRALHVAVLIQLLLSFLIALDDFRFARAEEELALRVDALGREGRGNGDCVEDRAPARFFVGHWGWQHALEARGWSPAEEDGTLAEGAVVAWARSPWPQELSPGLCLEKIQDFSVKATFPYLRVHTLAGRANLHANLLAGRPPVETYAPFAFSTEPYEEATLFRVCAEPSR